MAHLINRESRGVFVIAATPFDNNGYIDFESTDKLLDFYMECGIDGITILGVMGEAPKLSGQESAAFAKHVLQRVGAQIPVVVGVSDAGIDNLQRLAATSMDAGAAGVMISPQPNQTTEARVRGYFAEICQALGPDVPICLQDYPQGSGVPISIDTILHLTTTYGQIVMLKHEDWPGLNKLTAVRSRTGHGSMPRMSIMTGMAGLFLPLELRRGADGAMTGFAYPEMMVQVVKKHFDGDPDSAEDLFDAYLPLVRYEQQIGIGLAVRKEILLRRGILASSRVRAPGPKLSNEDQAELTRLIVRLEHRLKEIA